MKEKILDILEKHYHGRNHIESRCADELLSLLEVSERLHNSLGYCVKGNDYDITANKEGQFWINHKEVGSGEPLKQWIDSVLNVR